MSSVQPIVANPGNFNYGMYGVNQGKQLSSFDYIRQICNEVDIQQAEIKVRILANKINSPDTTPQQKYILQAMYNDAQRDFALLKQKLNVA